MTNHVKVYGVKPRIQYTADGSLTTYEFPFAIFKASDIDVYFGETLQDSDSYTVQGVCSSDGGSVTFSTPPVSGTTITLVRDLSIERTSDFQEGASLRAQVLNDELDYQVACQQQLADTINRSMVLPPYAIGTDVNLTLPAPCAGKSIVWNADGTNLENSTIEVNSLESTLNGYKTEAQTAAFTASGKAEIATTQAGIASAKATEAISAADQLTGTRTNCLSEIPQDLTFELSEGTLTLKSGSVMTLPDGTRKNISVDKTKTITTNGTYLIYSNATNGNLNHSLLNKVGSGSVLPADGTTYTLFYNSTDGKIYHWSNGAWSEYSVSLPECIVTVTDGAISKINKIFNGIGFIGQTLFAIQNIKGLIPNGRNHDGTLNNTPFTTQTLLLCPISGTYANRAILINETSLTVADNAYNEESNTNSNASYCVAGVISAASDQIVSLDTKAAFRSLDWNDKRTVVAWGIPDISRAATITLPYVADNDCYIAFKHVGESDAAKVGNGIVIDGIYGCGGINGLWGQTVTPNMYGGLYVPQGSTVSAMSNVGTYTVYKIPLKGIE